MPTKRHLAGIACLALLPLAVTLLAVSGCGGGADTEPTVKLKPKTTEDETDGGPGGEKAAAPAADTEDVGTGFGTLAGKIIYDGEAPGEVLKFAKGEATKDPQVCGLQAIPDQSLLVSNGGIENVFVYLDRAPSGGKPEELPSEPVKFDQEFCVFIPHAVTLPTEHTIKVLNSDGIAHNTHIEPKRNNPFNTVISPNDQVGVDLVYTRPEAVPVEVKCDIHPWMLAWHLPLDHPYKAVTDEEGNFEIAELPAGTHSFRIWHEKGGQLERGYSVTIKGGETTNVEIPFTPERFASFKGPRPKTLFVSTGK